MSHITFRGNKRSTRHGWLRLTPAYSVELVRELTRELPKSTQVLDPFCGTGTTLLSCAEQGLSCTTLDLNPFLVWLANAKAQHYSAGERLAAKQLVKRMASAAAGSGPRAWVPPLSNIDRWWGRKDLSALSRAAQKLGGSRAKPAGRDLARLAFCRALIRSAGVSFGHQSMSFAQERKPHDVATLLDEELYNLLVGVATPLRKPQLGATLGDARNLGAVLKRRRFGAVITSPPYCNRMSYIRELRPYMYWLKYLCDARGAGELDWKAIGGTWGIATSRLKHWQAPARGPRRDRGLKQILNGVESHSPVLARYIERYFLDMAEHVASLKPQLARGARVNYVVGNSVFFGVMVPTQELLAGQFDRAGFQQVRIQVLRSRTSKRELYEYLVSARSSPC